VLGDPLSFRLAPDADGVVVGKARSKPMTAKRSGILRRACVEWC
jgi:hypothetical protein